MTFLIRIAASLLLAGLPCNIQSSNKTATKGELIAVDDRQATLVVDGVEQNFPLDEIQKITADDARQTTRPELSLLVKLTDNSQIIAQQFTLASRMATIAPWFDRNTRSQLKGYRQSTSRKGIAWVRFGQPSESSDSQWNEILAVEHEGDTLVIRKGGGALDYLEGVVIAMDEQLVTFQYDGDEIPVKRTKLEGVLFYQRGANDGEELDAEPALIATLQNGSRLRGASLSVAEDLLTVTTVGGIKWTEPITSLANVDYAIGRTLFLSDVEPVEVVVTPHIASSLDEELTQLLYKPRINVSHNNRSLQLRDPSDSKIETYPKGLCLHSRTEITYRLNNSYRQFHTLAGIAPELGDRGAARLIISADGDTLLEETIKGGQPAITIDLDVTRRRRITIVVDYEDKLDVADRVHLCDLRVTK